MERWNRRPAPSPGRQIQRLGTGSTTQLYVMLTIDRVLLCYLDVFLNGEESSKKKQKTQAKTRYKSRTEPSRPSHPFSASLHIVAFEQYRHYPPMLGGHTPGAPSETRIASCLLLVCQVRRFHDDDDDTGPASCWTLFSLPPLPLPSPGPCPPLGRAWTDYLPRLFEPTRSQTGGEKKAEETHNTCTHISANHHHHHDAGSGVAHGFMANASNTVCSKLGFLPRYMRRYLCTPLPTS